MNKITELENKCRQENIDINLITDDLSHVLYSSAERTLGINQAITRDRLKQEITSPKDLKEITSKQLIDLNMIKPLKMYVGREMLLRSIKKK